MNTLEIGQIDKIIQEIKKDIPSFVIDEKYLKKFSSSPVDQEFLSYLDGIGGSYTKFLALLIKKLQPKNVVELGNREGLSTLSMFTTLPQDSKFTTIDIEKDQRYCPDEMFTDKRVSFIFGDVGDPKIVENIPLNIDILFSDTIHYNFQVTDEFEIYQHLLSDTALFAIDDIYLNDKNIFWDKLKYHKWDLTELCHINGWGLFLYKREQPLSDEARRYNAMKAAATILQRKYVDLYTKEEHRANNKPLRKAKNLIKKNPHLYKLGVKILNSLGK